MLPDAAAINPPFERTILERMRTRPGTQHSNLGGWQSGWDLLDWGGPEARRVVDQAVAMAEELTCDRQGNAVTVDWQVNAWANVNGAGHGNEFHTHPGSYWSGTYYVQDGGIADDPALGGELEVQDPRGVAPAMYAPKLAFRSAGGQSAGGAETIPPRAGLMIMFPAWLSHAVRPYRGQRQRISIAFNLGI